MKFKYGSFFGMTAVHALFLGTEQFNALFQNLNVKKSTLYLLNNLYLETIALKKIFEPAADQTLDLPHVLLSVDEEHADTQAFIKGFNCFLESKQKIEAPAISEEDIFDAVSDIDNLMIDTSDTPDLPEISDTSFFTEAPDEQSNPLDNLFDDMTASKNTAAAVDISGLLNELTDIDPKSTDNPFDVFYNTQPETTYKDLIKWGRREEPRAPKCSRYLQIVTYLKLHKRDFSEEEYASITEQMSFLPKLPKSITLPVRLKQAITPLSKDSSELLGAIYSRMTRRVNGMPYIDYLIERLQMMLYSSSTESRLFFAPVSVFNSGVDKTSIGVNRFLTDLNAQYLSKDIDLLSNVDILLQDCNIALGDEHVLQSTQASLDDIRALLDEDPDTIRNTELLRELCSVIGLEVDDHNRSLIYAQIQDMFADGLLQPLLSDSVNLRFILDLYQTLHNLVTREMYGALRLSNYISTEDETLTPEDIQYAATDLFTSFVKETGICGLTAEFSTRFKNTLKSIGTPLIAVNVKPFEHGTNNRRMVELLKKHLISAKKRRVG